jgi:3-deoxy-D-manno-octulosonic-acid transferase
LKLLLYNIAIKIYSFAIWLASFFNTKAKKMITGRHQLFDKLATKMSDTQTELIWVHCASLGEFEQGRPIIESLRAEFPKYKILLTFFSPSGYDIRKNYDKADFVSYLPLDTAENATKFLQISKPKIAIFVKYEIWYHFINQLAINKVPVFLVSANFRENQIFFKSYGDFFAKILHKFDHIFVQNSASRNLLKSVNYEAITVAGDTRFDRVRALVDAANNLPVIEKFKGDKKLFVIGSAWALDIDFLIDFLNENSNDFQTIIAPHEINQPEIEKWANALVNTSIKYSEISSNFEFESERILFIDNIGLLSGIYKYADVVWIGGAFGDGLHNILEAATYGNPIFFGNRNYAKFQEALDLIALEVAFSISELHEFKLIFEKIITDENLVKNIVLNSQNYVIENTGATTKIMNYLRPKL